MSSGHCPAVAEYESCGIPLLEVAIPRMKAERKNFKGDSTIHTTPLQEKIRSLVDLRCSKVIFHLLMIDC
jgi:hypothetical protein